ncbi:hypothetical protein WDW37_08715 [Bdellovibrionota bacterium FG-1]
MQKNEIVGFLGRMNEHLTEKFGSLLVKTKFELKIIGKSALLIGGMTDTVGTADIDSLVVQGKHKPADNKKIVENLLAEFGSEKILINGYYLQFVAPAFVFLPRSPQWISFGPDYACLSVQYLAPRDVIASKLFSAFSNTPRKRDKQDVIAALDQKLVDFQEVLNTADDIFDLHSMDARSDRFPDVYAFIVNDLMGRYGTARLEYKPDEDW